MIASLEQIRKRVLEEVVLWIFFSINPEDKIFVLFVSMGINFSPFYWSGRDLAADMFSMERDQKKETGQIQHN